MKTLKLLKRKDGAALITVVLVFLVLIVLLGGISALTNSNLKQSKVATRTTAAYYAAESGINLKLGEFKNLLQDLKNNTVSEATFESETLAWVAANMTGVLDLASNNGNAVSSSYVITGPVKDGEEDVVTFVSTGTVGSDTRILRTEIRYKYTVGDGNGFNIDKAVLSKTTIDLGSSDVYDGPIATYLNTPNAITFGWGSTAKGVQIPSGADRESTVYIPGKPYSSYNTFINVNPQPGEQTGFEAITYLPEEPELPEIIMPTIVVPTRKLNEGLDGGVLRFYQTSCGTPLPSWCLNQYFELIDANGSFKKTSTNDWILSQYPGYVYQIPNGSSQYYVPEFIVSGNVNLTIDVGNSDKILVVDKLDISGKITITGNGKLTIHVRGNTPTTKVGSTSSIFNLGWTGSGDSLTGRIEDPSKLVVYVEPIYLNSGTPTVTVSGSSKYYLSLMAANLDVHMTGSASIRGHLVTGGANVSITGGSDSVIALYYAPNASCTLNGSGTLRGAIICNKFTASGGAAIYFDKTVLLNFPFAVLDPVSGGSGSGSSTLLVNSGAVIED